MIKKTGIVSAIVFFVVCIFFCPDCVYSAQSAADMFQDANRAYVGLSRDASKRKLRSNWMDVIRKYASVEKTRPKASFAPRAMYMEGKLYEQLYGYSGIKADLKHAVKAFVDLRHRYPGSNLADDALYRAARIYHKRLGDEAKAYDLYTEVITAFPHGDMGQSATEGLNSLHLKKKRKDTKIGDLILVKKIRQWSNKDYTRVVVDLDNDVSFNTFILPPDKKADKPHRLVVDLNHTRTLPGFWYKRKVNDGILSDIRVCQNTKDRVRLVLDLSEKPRYQAFPLEDPSRIVIDLNAGDKKTARAAVPSDNGIKKVRSGVPSMMKGDVPSIARQLSLKVSCIVIDPGHGGKDPGAIGPRGVMEKDITLEISRLLAKRLKAKGYRVFLTRNSDCFVPLEERTAIANRKKADLFLSIHINANSTHSVRGIETFFLNLTTDASAIQVAARENATNSKSLSDLQLILNDLMLNSKINESSRFASSVQTSLMKSVKGIGYAGRDLGVRQAPFYVLLGAQMPSILLELGFITNPKDCALLRKGYYQKNLADAISRGINDYVKGTTYVYDGRKK